MRFCERLIIPVGNVDRHENTAFKIFYSFCSKLNDIPTTDASRQKLSPSNSLNTAVVVPDVDFKLMVVEKTMLLLTSRLPVSQYHKILLPYVIFLCS